jgi:hypothetical protein
MSEQPQAWQGGACEGVLQVACVDGGATFAGDRQVVSSAWLQGVPKQQGKRCRRGQQGPPRGGKMLRMLRECVLRGGLDRIAIASRSMLSGGPCRHP